MRDELQGAAQASAPVAQRATLPVVAVNPQYSTNPIFHHSNEAGLHPLGDGLLVQLAHQRSSCKVSLGGAHTLGIELHQAVRQQQRG